MNREIEEYQNYLDTLCNGKVLIKKTDNDPELPPPLQDGIYLKMPDDLEFKNFISDETLKPPTLIRSIPNSNDIGIYIPHDKTPLLCHTITSCLKNKQIIIQLEERIAKLRANSCSSFFRMNDKKTKAYQALLNDFKNAPLEKSQEDIFCDWEKKLNQPEQLEQRTAMASHRCLFYAKDSRQLTTSEKMIQDIRNIIFPQSKGNLREEIIHQLIHRISKLTDSKERSTLEDLLENIQKRRLNSTKEEYYNVIIRWEQKNCLADSDKDNKTFLQEKTGFWGVFGSYSHLLLEKIKQQLMPTQAKCNNNIYYGLPR